MPVIWNDDSDEADAQPRGTLSEDEYNREQEDIMKNLDYKCKKVQQEVQLLEEGKEIKGFGVHFYLNQLNKSKSVGLSVRNNDTDKDKRINNLLQKSAVPL